jgi:2,3-dihydroxybenzoate-AMP ligase
VPVSGAARRRSNELPLTKVGKIDKKRLLDIVRGKADSVEAV